MKGWVFVTNEVEKVKALKLFNKLEPNERSERRLQDNVYQF